MGGTLTNVIHCAEAAIVQMRTFRLASPIEKMIDEACGITNPTGPVMVLMSCRKCNHSKWIVIHESFPEGTAEIRFECLGCETGCKCVNFGRMDFYDKVGRRLSF